MKQVAQTSQFRIYDPAASVVFLKTKEKFGGLSNMAPGFPLMVNGVRIRTSEALYQACRFPHMPEVQSLIIDQHSPMTAKMRSKPFRKQSRSDWDAVRVKVMRWCLRVKLAQNWREFRSLLLSTGERPIVEQSRKDDFWGAKVVEDGTLMGMNVLGRLLMELREQLKGEVSERLRIVEPLPIPQFLLLQRQIEAVYADREIPISGEVGKRLPQITLPAQIKPSQPALFDPSAISCDKINIHDNRNKNINSQLPLQPYPQYKNSGQPFIGTMPAHWVMFRNGRLFSQRNETGFGELPILEVSLKTGVRVRDMENLKRKQVMSDREKYKRAIQGDIAYNMMRMWQGAVGVAPVDGLVSPAYVVVRPFPEVDCHYFTYLFRTDSYMSEVDAYSRGIVKDRNRLYWQDFKRMPSVVPPVEEQRNIARYLAGITAQINRFIRKKRRLMELFAERREAVTQNALNLTDTRQLRLSVVADQLERPVNRRAAEFYTAVGLFNRGRGMFHKEPTKGAELGDSSFYWIETGDLVFSGQFAWEGAIALAGENDVGCVASHRYPIVRGKPGLAESAYLLSFFKTSIGHLLLDLNSRGAAGRNRPLNIRTLMKEKIPVPPLHAQQHIARLVSEEADLRQKIAREITLIGEYRSRLIADVVTGKVDVRGIEVLEVAEDELLDLDEDTTEADEMIDDEGDRDEAD